MNDKTNKLKLKSSRLLEDFFTFSFGVCATVKSPYPRIINIGAAATTAFSRIFAGRSGLIIGHQFGV